MIRQYGIKAAAPLLLLATTRVASQALTCGNDYTNGDTFFEGGVQYQVGCQLNVPSGFLAEQAAASFTECADQCNAYNAALAPGGQTCVAGVITSSPGGTSCILRNESLPSQSETGVDSIFAVPNNTEVCQGQENESQFTLGDYQYEVLCSEDFAALTLAHFDNGPSYSGCAESCANWTSQNPQNPCIAFTVPSASNADPDAPGIYSCNLKGYPYTAPDFNPNFDRVNVVNPPPVSSSVSSSATTSSESASSAAISATSATEASSSAASSSTPASSAATSSTPVSSATDSSATASSATASSATGSSATGPASSTTGVSSLTGTARSVTSSAASLTGTATLTTGTGTATVSVSSSTASGTSVPYRLQVIAPNFNGGFALYVTLTGGLVNSSSDAVIVQIVNEQLFTYNGPVAKRQLLGAQYSANAGTDYQLLAPLTPLGDITTRFVVAGGPSALDWYNAAFTNGIAGWCIGNNQLYATFVTPNPSVCEFDANVVAVPIESTSSTASATTASATSSATAGTVVNNYYNTTTYNNVVYNINVNFALPLGFNYFSNDPDTFYAQLCPVCPVVQVYKANLTYASSPCPVCPPQVMQLASCGCSSHSSGAANYAYGASTCLTCATNTSAPVSGLTAVPLPCPTCPGGSTAVVCPSAAVSSVQAAASASGPAAAASIAAQAVASGPYTVTAAPAAATASGPALATSTVINVVCPRCAAATPQVAVTLPQIPASSPSNSSAISPPISAFKGAASQLVAGVSAGGVYICAAAFMAFAMLL